ncbi:hypothetical protein GIB67_030874 [Kingdonia uniflora]|uniref:Protein kinase domain-containing protein n=1 Tax=Kingdonia uniflora TaxID=39325 RepID=A0A7J7L396_9MAGN|nr:hypothetical protein GIB67_030874 [Kingdonia uniflora]
MKRRREGLIHMLNSIYLYLPIKTARCFATWNKSVLMSRDKEGLRCAVDTSRNAQGRFFKAYKLAKYVDNGWEGLESQKCQSRIETNMLSSKVRGVIRNGHIFGKLFQQYFKREQIGTALRETFSDIVGSAYYIAPEMLSMNYGPEVDIWSVEVILYILLSGTTLPPLRVESEEEIMKLNLEGKLNFKESLTEISESAKDLLGKMLERDPKKRITAYKVLCHPWIVDDNVILDKPLDFVSLSSSKSSSVIHNNLFIYLYLLGEKDPGIIFELQENLQVFEERTVRRCLEVSIGTPYECISIPKDELWGKMEDLHRELEITKLLSDPNILRIKDINPDSFIFSNVDEEAPLKATSFKIFTFYKPGETFSDMVGMANYIAPEMLSMEALESMQLLR